MPNLFPPCELSWIHFGQGSESQLRINRGRLTSSRSKLHVDPLEWALKGRAPLSGDVRVSYVHLEYRPSHTQICSEEVETPDRRENCRTIQTLWVYHEHYKARNDSHSNAASRGPLFTAQSSAKGRFCDWSRILERGMLERVSRFRMCTAEVAITQCLLP